MTKNITLFVMIICSFIMLCFAAEPNKKALIIATELWPPYYTQEDGQGLYQKIVKQVFNDRQVTYLYTPYDVSKKLVEKGQADFWLGANQDEEDFAITPEEGYDMDRVAVVYSGSFTKSEVVSALKNASVAWRKGYDYQLYFPDYNMQYYEVPDIKTGLNMLSVGRVQFYLEDLDDISRHLVDVKSQYPDIKMYEFARLYVYPSFNDNAQGQVLAEQWDKKLKEMKQDGSLKSIYDNYGDPYLFDGISEDNVLIKTP